MEGASQLRLRRNSQAAGQRESTKRSEARNYSHGLPNIRQSSRCCALLPGARKGRDEPRWNHLTQDVH
ncbi:uncharacterized protein THITE_2115168 [Thermothielavioides terrestris NRRL 8126]|uniref:Uncharacterized protein n=1 Tax=Thermothielavioides terrestris (strain ATCC 38088 / NRRL 8126) TaxID=578455 RepID=G2R3G7_THETT|nr:uncharacterized protein THITE_2115168 [Thermothielavioides terrestris NRRL 8126]AEO66777.1 hypothetical protein THITE_2115168 [Thermothielavioides terrestris NRRL 8126]